METAFVVGEAEAGQRLDVVVAGRTGWSRSVVARQIADGGVLVDDQQVAKSHACLPGERVTVAEPTADEVGPPPPLPPVRHRDEHVAVIAKPAGLVVHPGAGHVGDTLADALRAAGFPPTGPDPSRPGIVHRLDRETSGLLVVACSDRGHEGLVSQLAARDVERAYLALVVGDPPERARVDGPIGRDPRDRTRFAVVADGKPAVTTWERLGTGPGCALLACRLETGRTHQIRVHAASAGHPIAGDVRYGGRRLGTQLGLERMFLHAAKLAFRHPVTGESLVFTEPLPEDLREALERTGMSADGLEARL